MTTTFTHPSTIETNYYRRPYLNFKEKLTQLLLNPYTVFLLLFIIKLLFFLNSLVNSLEQAKSQTHALYDSIGIYASEIVSFPHYISKASNLMIAKSIESANHGLMKTLTLMITASEELIMFIIELSVGTYACLLTAVIDDTVMVALNATESVITTANDTLISFAKELNVGLGDLSDVINDVIHTADDTGDALKHLFKSGGKTNQQSNLDEQLNKVNLTIKNMQDWQIPGSINDKIEDLKDKIPDFTDVQNFTRKIIDKPFGELKRQVNTHLNNTFDADSMYVPPKTQLDFSNGSAKINEIYVDMINVAQVTTHVIMGIIGLAALLLIGYELYRELKDWRRIMEAANHLNFTNESFIKSLSKKKYNVEVIKIMQDRTSNFLSSIITEKIFRLRNPILINNIRWFFNYSASPFLLSFLLLGLLGIATVICQFIILSFISNLDFSQKGNELFHNTQTQIYGSFNDSLNQWTNETNNYIGDYQDDINDNLFAWVDTAAMTINNTVSEFDEKMNKALDALFKGTPLYEPIEQIVGCVIESKLKKIENAMTWLSDNAHLEMPELNPKTILAEMASIKAANVNDSFDDSVEKFKSKAKNILNQVIKFYKHQNMILLYISLCILGIWFLFSMVGLSILLVREWRIRKRQKASNFEKYSNDVSSTGGKSDHDDDDDDNFMLNETMKSNDNVQKDSESTLREPFDVESFKTLLYQENNDTSIPRLSKIIQNIRNQYIKAKTNYVPTPTESKPRMDHYLSENYKVFQNHNDSEYSATDSLDRIIKEQEEKMRKRNQDPGSIWKDESTLTNNNNSDNITVNRLTLNDGTLSIIGENMASVTQARQWNP